MIFFRCQIKPGEQHISLHTNVKERMFTWQIFPTKYIQDTYVCMHWTYVYFICAFYRRDWFSGVLKCRCLIIYYPLSMHVPYLHKLSTNSRWEVFSMLGEVIELQVLVLFHNYFKESRHWNWTLEAVKFLYWDNSPFVEFYIQWKSIGNLHTNQSKIMYCFFCK